MNNIFNTSTVIQNVHRLFVFIFVISLLSACDQTPTTGALAAAPEITSKTGIGDFESGQQIALQKCASCHGLHGASKKSGAPFIAGIEQDYFVQVIIGYTKSYRKDEEMNRIAAELSPKDLADVSAYYSSLNTSWRGTTRERSSDKQITTVLESNAKHCNSCHGSSGNNPKDNLVPSLSGMSAEYFSSSLKSYFNGARDSQIMRTFKVALSEKQITNLARYYAAQTPVIPAPTNSGDSNTGKILAKACAGCHGYNGNSPNPYMPNLAGQPAKYLVKAIKDYRDGKRKEELMQSAVRHLNDNDIPNLAAYYTKQHPETLTTKDKSTDGKFNPIADGKKIATTCNSCHGKDGNSNKKGIPSLTGLHSKYLISAIEAYQNGSRQHATMKKLVAHLNDTDIEKIAYYYATRKPITGRKISLGNLVQGEKLSERCTMCHGKKGISPDPAQTPSLAGQETNYITVATKAYTKKERTHISMNGVINGLTNGELYNIAAYFAAQTPTKVDTYLPDNPATIVKNKCNRCHGDKGYSDQPGMPRLAGQLESYLIYSLRQYQDGHRKNKTMQAMADGLSLIEIKGIAAYYAKQQAPSK